MCVGGEADINASNDNNNNITNQSIEQTNASTDSNEEFNPMSGIGDISNFG